MKKRILKLINDERKSVSIVSKKGAGCTGGAIDICPYIDAAYCGTQAFDKCSILDYAACKEGADDTCTKDYAACQQGADDNCGIDTTVCIGPGQPDRS